MLRVLITFLFITTVWSISAQENIDLEEKVNAYFEAENPHQQYDALASLMEYNASVTPSEAAYYFEKYNRPEYQEKDARYALLSHFIAADVLYYADNSDSSLYHYLTLAQLARDTDENMFAVTGLGNAAFLINDSGDILGAINLLKSNFDIIKNTGDIRDYSDHLYNLAQFYSHLEMRDSAIHYFEQTIAIDRRANNRSGMLYNMHILLRKYLESNELEKALELSLECVAVSQEEKNTRAHSQCCASLAMTYEALGQLENAEKWIEEAIRIDHSRGDSTRMSRYHRISGDIAMKRNHFLAANAHYEKAMSLAEKYVSKEDEVMAHLSFAEALYEQEKLDRAFNLASKCNSLVSEDQFYRYRIKNLNLLGKIEEKRGNLHSALDFMRKESEVLASQLAAKNLQAAEQSKNSFDIFQVENEKRVLQAEKQLAESKIKRRNNLIVTSAIILFLAGILTYFLIQNRMQRAHLEAQELEYQVVEKELLALRSQMNPHFLFNSLNSINDYIMHKEPREASRYLTKFSTLMRTILNNSKERLITLETELEALKLYVDMENLRFAEQFDYKVSISVTSDQLKIPSMLLQPYVENAIKHGLRNSDRKGILSLKIRETNGKFHIEIYDNGIGREAAKRYKSRNDNQRKSHGLDITKDRIDALNKIYDIEASIDIQDHYKPTGTTVLIKLRPLDT